MNQQVEAGAIAERRDWRGFSPKGAKKLALIPKMTVLIYIELDTHNIVIFGISRFSFGFCFYGFSLGGEGRNGGDLLSGFSGIIYWGGVLTPPLAFSPREGGGAGFQ